MMAHLSLFTNRKLFLLCEELGIDIPQAVGHLECLWVSVYQDKTVSTNGVLVGWDETDIEGAARWKGAKGDFSRSLMHIGFVDLSDHGELAIHDYGDWCPHFIRKRTTRAKKADPSGHVPPCPDKVENVSYRREEKRIEEKVKDKDTCAKKPAQARVRVDESQVETLWKAYPPPKGSKKAALPHIRASLKKYPDNFDRILASVVRYAEAHRDGKFVKQVFRWFRDENFNDEAATDSKPKLGPHWYGEPEPPKETQSGPT